MDIEEFRDEGIKDELLKVVDEMLNRGFTKKEINEHIENGKRNIRNI